MQLVFFYPFPFDILHLQIAVRKHPAWEVRLLLSLNYRDSMLQLFQPSATPESSFNDAERLSYNASDKFEVQSPQAQAQADEDG
jgi:hypothetical protein